MKKEKRGQLKLSFGMIFSIILIIVFLAFAFYAIKIFLGHQNDIKASMAVNSIQEDVTRVQRSQRSSEVKEYTVPSYADFVCFVDFNSQARGEHDAFLSELRLVDYGEENFVFYPVEFTGFESAEIKHLNLEETTADENPLCLQARNQRVSLVLQKNYGEALVTITKNT